MNVLAFLWWLPFESDCRYASKAFLYRLYRITASRSIGVEVAGVVGVGSYTVSYWVEVVWARACLATAVEANNEFWRVRYD